MNYFVCKMRFYKKEIKIYGCIIAQWYSFLFWVRLGKIICSIKVLAFLFQYFLLLAYCEGNQLRIQDNAFIKTLFYHWAQKSIHPTLFHTTKSSMHGTKNHLNTTSITFILVASDSSK